MDALLGWADAGTIAPSAVTTYALGDVADAHRALESGTTVGKLVLVP
jgi:NADPH:quinone reductase-like Zn-dependent oxidoreductase